MSDKKNDLWVGPATDENLAEFKKAQRPRDYDADKHDQLADFKRMKSKNHLAELVNERDELGAELETTREALRIAREERDTAIRERHECDMANAEAVHDLRAKLEVAEGDLAAAREGWDEARADLAMVRDRLTKVREWLDGLLPDVDISVSALTDGLGILEDDLPDSNEPEPQPIVKRVEVDFSTDAYKRLQNLKKAAEKPSLAATIQDALGVYEWFLEATRTKKVLTEDEQGNLTEVKFVR